MECGVGEEFMDRRLEGGAGTASREEGDGAPNRGLSGEEALPERTSDRPREGP